MSPAIRTQVYLTEEQRSAIAALTKSEGLSLAETIREALDQYLMSKRGADINKNLDTTFGALPDLKVPDRSEWDRT